MTAVRVARRYAKSLLELAAEQQVLDRVYADMLNFAQYLENREFNVFIKSPVISGSKKEKVFDLVFKDKYIKLTNLFFNTIIRKRREAYLPEIAVEFLHQYKIYNNITEIKLTTAYPLGENELSSIAAKIKESSLSGDTLDIQLNVDERIIGGFILQVGDKLYDASVRHKLNVFKNELINN